MSDVKRYYADHLMTHKDVGYCDVGDAGYDVVLASTYDALAAENAALKADAERYRWLVKRNPTYFDDIDREMANEANAVQPDVERT